jgi:hypothetical protein
MMNDNTSVVFWHVVLYSLMDKCQCLEEDTAFIFSPEDVGSRFL